MEPEREPTSPESEPVIHPVIMCVLCAGHFAHWAFILSCVGALRGEEAEDGLERF